MPELYHLFINYVGPNWAAILAVLIPCLVVFLGIQGVAGFSTYVERKIAADIQRRVGPNKCNSNAFLGEFARQWIERTREDKRGGMWGLLSKIIALLLKPAVPLFKFLDKVLPPGVLIFLADGIKLIMKEDIIPDPVDKPLFKLAPTVVLASSFGALAVLPYSDAWYVADFNIGIFYIAAITSIEVLGILMAGWASN